MEIRFAGYFTNVGHTDLWLSLLYAMLEGLSEVLGIARDDLNGTVYPYSAGLPPALVLFDNVPGGAGHVRRLNDGVAFVEVMKQTLQRVANCECGKETSCYECLRNFYNQYVHEQLQRGLVVDFLTQLLNQH